MTEQNDSDDRDRRVASGFPDPADVPGPTERLRQVHGANATTEPKPPRYGRASASTAGSEDYVSIDEMARESSGAEGAADRAATFARRIGDDLAGRIGAELVKRGAAETAKTAGVGVAEIGAAGILGLCALGATGTAMIVALNKVIPMWASSLVAAGAFGIPAGILAARGARHVQAIAAIGSPAQP